MSHLLIAHAENHKLTLYDASELHAIREFELPGRIAMLGISSDGRYGFAIHRDDDCISIIESHGEVVRAITTSGKQPTHFHAHAGYCLIFNDGSGSVMIFDETDIPRHINQVVRQPDHGSALKIGDYLVVGYLRGGCVDVYRWGEAEPVQTFDCCPMLHGAAQVGDTALFGCSDGVLVLKPDGGNFAAKKLPNPPDTPDRVRVGLLATHEASGFAAGNFGQGLVLIDPAQATMRVLPLSDYPLKFSFDASGDHIHVLTCDGLLQRISVTDDDRQAVSVVGPVVPPKGPDKKVRPTFAAYGDWLYVTDPEQQKVLRVSASELIEDRRASMHYKPAAVAYLKNSFSKALDESNTV